MPELHGLSAPRFVPTRRLQPQWQEPFFGEEDGGANVEHAAGPLLGEVVAVGGAGAEIMLDASALENCAENADRAVAMAGQVGSQIKIRTRQGWLLASVRDQRRARADTVGNAGNGAGSGADHGEGGVNGAGNGGGGGETPAPAIEARIDFLGEGLEDAATGRILRFRRGITRYPLPGAPVFPATSEDLSAIHTGDGRSAISIGTVYPTHDIGACLYVDALLGRHFALLGSTGTGKSTALALILHRIIAAAPHGHVVMIDPHGEYGAAFAQEGMVFDVANLKMPYWLMNFEEHCEVLLAETDCDAQEDRDVLAKCLLAARQKSHLAGEQGRLTVDSPVPYLLSDLLRMLTDEMGSLDKPGTAAPYMRIKAKIEELRTDPRYAFMFSGMLVGDTMVEFLGDILRLPGNGRPIAIIDVSGVPSDITKTVVAMLARMVFDLAIWGRTEPARPVLLVCEEAHRYVPSEARAEGSSVGRVLGRIAKEGRKYGIALGLVTQRPSDLAESVLSQCGTIIAMRLNNERDQAFVKAAMPEGARGFLDSIPALRNRECIICGEGVTIPIRVSFDELEQSHRPASADPSFLSLWHDTGGDADSLSRIVQRWRTQGG